MRADAVDRRRAAVESFARRRLRLPTAICLAVLPLAWAFAAKPALPPRISAERARDYVRSLLVKSPYRMSQQARNGEVRYRLRFEPAMRWVWPETGEQHVIGQHALVDTRGDELRICADCGREPAPSAEDLRRYTQANAWVRSDDRRIRSFARRYGRGGTTHLKMLSLVIAVRKHMTGAIDYRDYHDAVTALESRSGDCTEYAVLLAAASRSLGIPTRLAHGLAYASRFTGEAHVFSPHMWVQAWDGQRWVSYDAGLQRFDAGHIALYVGDGTTAGLQGLSRAMRALRIDEAVGILPSTPMQAPSPAPADTSSSSSSWQSSSGAR